MASQWYCRLMGTEMGPFTSKELLEMAQTHKVTPEDWVKKGADGKWVEAHRVKGLFDDTSSSTIIMAKLPPDVQQALEAKQSAARSSARPPDADPTPTDEPGAVTWHYISSDGHVGPLSFETLIAHSRQGLVKPKSRVWSSASPKWCEARDVEGLEFTE